MLAAVAAADGRGCPVCAAAFALATLRPDQALDPSVTCRCCLSLSRSTSRSMVSPMAQRSSALNRSLEFLPHHRTLSAGSSRDPNALPKAGCLLHPRLLQDVVRLT